MKATETGPPPPIKEKSIKLKLRAFLLACFDGGCGKPDKPRLSRESQFVDRRVERGGKEASRSVSLYDQRAHPFYMPVKTNKKESKCGYADLTCTNGRIINGATKREIRVVEQTDKQNKDF